MMRIILGISAFYHDSAAALIIDGNIVAAVQQERFSRLKHDPGFPADAVRYCLKTADCQLDDVDAIVFYDKPLLKFERLLETFLVRAPFGFTGFVRAMPVWLKEKLYLKHLLRKELRALSGSANTQTRRFPLLFTEHHQSHAASAYYPSPFHHAIVICLDGVGEWTTTSVWEGKGNTLTALSELHFPHSLGLLYSAFTFYCGFKVNSGEYKLMGLAPYGSPKYADLIRTHLIDSKADGSFRLDLRYFDYETGRRMTSQRFHDLFGRGPWPQDKEPDQMCMDLASSIQMVIEEVVLNIARYARSRVKTGNLCLAGGVALNCVANGKLREAAIFDNIWVQPAAGDAGGALGAALAAWYSQSDVAEKPAADTMQAACLGPAYSDADICQAMTEWAVNGERLDDDKLSTVVASYLADNHVVGWYQGRAEYGPRALGNRSILGNPASETMQRVMNVKIKQRESFRPFAPAIRLERLGDYFDTQADSPYMLDVARLLPRHCYTVSASEGLDKVNDKRSAIPAVTHLDYSARVQTVTSNDNPRFYALLCAFEAQTGLPVLINTSFNVRGEPPVLTPADAIRCFLATEMDYLVLGNYLLDRRTASARAIQRARQTTFEKD
ncbi:carbamoyltransferase family protein [Alteromonas halophila]|uniref:Nodulation protein n=1 Tax=Alteromonas halophila TaxID=516698 RepID=A0A918JM16_9ALTE|nr:carbamoyltransferase [Alteromonas halophila]GGW88122.1 nodulation protein [Alteromonas halophila]